MTARPGDLGAQDIVRLLDLKPHPEGGHYGETFRAAGAGRASSTAIYYLLQAGETSAWHRVDADEHWLWHAGAPLSLTLASERGNECVSQTLGANLSAGERPQLTVPAGHWQTATSRGPWTLVSCIVAPGFEFSGFELAPDGWRPGA